MVLIFVVVLILVGSDNLAKRDGHAIDNQIANSAVHPSLISIVVIADVHWETCPTEPVVPSYFIAIGRVNDGVVERECQGRTNDLNLGGIPHVFNESGANATSITSVIGIRSSSGEEVELSVLSPLEIEIGSGVIAPGVSGEEALEEDATVRDSSGGGEIVDQELHLDGHIATIERIEFGSVGQGDAGGN